MLILQLPDSLSSFAYSTPVQTIHMFVAGTWGLGGLVDKRREPGFIKRSPRVDTQFATSLTDSDGNRIEVVVMDISREGCRLHSEGNLKIGEMVQIDVPKYGTFPAQIRWALGNEAGAVFLEPVFLQED